LSDKGLQVRRVVADVGGDDVIGNELAEVIEPEERELGKDAPFVRDPGAEHVVKGGDSIGGDEEKVGRRILRERIDVANLATRGDRKVTEIGGEQGRAGGGLGHLVRHQDDGITQTLRRVRTRFSGLMQAKILA